MSFERMWGELAEVGRDPASGGYRRFAWTDADLTLREWFAAAAAERGLDVVEDRAGNQWAWWGDPDVQPGVVAGSHLDSVPDGGAFDGPLGVVSALAALDNLRERGLRPARPIGVVNFGDEEGARFGVACAGSRLLTGALEPVRALGLRDAGGRSLAEVLTARGRGATIDGLGRDDETLRRIAGFVELHVEQGRGLADLDAPVAVGSAIWPHGRWRIELSGQANHAGTTRLADRHDPMLDLARVITEARAAAGTHGGLATVGKLRVEPNGVNAIASRVTAWLDARGPQEATVRAITGALAALLADLGPDAAALAEESWTGETAFDAGLRQRLLDTLGGPPVLATGAGHDAGILAAAGIPTGMLFVRNPTGVSHSPAEFAELEDCRAGVAALTEVLAELAGSPA